MSRALAVVVSLLAAATGGALGWWTRPAPSTRSARPDVVERALRALDAFERKGDRDALRAAAEAVGGPSAFPPPWRDEVTLVHLVAAGDDAALLAFVDAGPPGPARARALRTLSLVAKDPAARARAAARLAADYPASWAAAERAR
ncbi:MAG: hypothetical protein IT460_09060 [Planctomycetes bacterium]|nr:hypothetical protein [Planctomycetota bacterium]